MNSNDIGLNIKKYRKERKLTQKQLADLIEKAESSIQKYESGSVEIPMSVLHQIAAILNISTFKLLEIDSSENSKREKKQDIESILTDLLREIGVDCEYVSYAIPPNDFEFDNEKKECYEIIYNNEKFRISVDNFEEIEHSTLSFLKFNILELLKHSQKID